MGRFRRGGAPVLGEGGQTLIVISVWLVVLLLVAYLARVLLGLLPASLYVRRVFAWYA